MATRLDNQKTFATVPVRHTDSPSSSALSTAPPRVALFDRISRFQMLCTEYQQASGSERPMKAQLARQEFASISQQDPAAHAELLRLALWAGLPLFDQVAGSQTSRPGAVTRLVANTTRVANEKMPSNPAEVLLVDALHHFHTQGDAAVPFLRRAAQLCLHSGLAPADVANLAISQTLNDPARAIFEMFQPMDAPLLQFDESNAKGAGQALRGWLTDNQITHVQDTLQYFAAAVQLYARARNKDAALLVVQHAYQLCASQPTHLIESALTVFAPNDRGEIATRLANEPSAPRSMKQSFGQAASAQERFRLAADARATAGADLIQLGTDTLFGDVKFEKRALTPTGGQMPRWVSKAGQRIAEQGMQAIEKARGWKPDAGLVEVMTLRPSLMSMMFSPSMWKAEVLPLASWSDEQKYGLNGSRVDGSLGMALLEPLRRQCEAAGIQVDHFTVASAGRDSTHTKIYAVLKPTAAPVPQRWVSEVGQRLAHEGAEKIRRVGGIHFKNRPVELMQFVPAPQKSGPRLDSRIFMMPVQSWTTANENTDHGFVIDSPPGLSILEPLRKQCEAEGLPVKHFTYQPKDTKAGTPAKLFAVLDGTAADKRRPPLPITSAQWQASIVKGLREGRSDITLFHHNDASLRQLMARVPWMRSTDPDFDALRDKCVKEMETDYAARYRGQTRIPADQPTLLPIVEAMQQDLRVQQGVAVSFDWHIEHTVDGASSMPETSYALVATFVSHPRCEADTTFQDAVGQLYNPIRTDSPFGQRILTAAQDLGDAPFKMVHTTADLMQPSEVAMRLHAYHPTTDAESPVDVLRWGELRQQLARNGFGLTREGNQFRVHHTVNPRALWPLSAQLEMAHLETAVSAIDDLRLAQRPAFDYQKTPQYLPNLIGALNTHLKALGYVALEVPAPGKLPNWPQVFDVQAVLKTHAQQLRQTAGREPLALLK